MNFDRLFVSLWKEEYEPKINNNNLIKKRFSYVKGSKELYVIFPPWHSKLEYDRILRKRIHKIGASCLEYKFNGHFLSSDYKLTKKYFNLVKRRCVREIKKLIAEKGFKKIKFIGVSLGCVNTCMVAKQFEEIEKLILIVPGNCIAESLWNGIKTSRIRKKFERKKINLIKLKRAWKELAPEDNINKINFRKLRIYLSKKDRVIPYENGLELTRKVDKKRRMKTFVNHNLGHYLTAIKFYLFPKKFIYP